MHTTFTSLCDCGHRAEQHEQRGNPPDRVDFWKCEEPGCDCIVFLDAGARPGPA